MELSIREVLDCTPKGITELTPGLKELSEKLLQKYTQEIHNIYIESSSIIFGGTLRRTFRGIPCETFREILR